jgi:hypothetical protein
MGFKIKKLLYYKMVKIINFRGNCDFVESTAESRLYGDVGLLENENIVKESVNYPTYYGNTVMTINTNTVINSMNNTTPTYRQLIVNTSINSVNVDINAGTIIPVPAFSVIKLCWLQPRNEWIQVH